MRFNVRVPVLALLVGALVVLCVAPAAQALEAPGIEKFAAVNCKATHKDCAHTTVTKVATPFFGEEQTYSVTTEPGEPEAITEGYAKAGGHVPFGVTDFKVATVGELPTQAPTAVVKHIRTDVAAGLATNPQAIPMCSAAQFGTELAGSGFYHPPTCETATEIGLQQATVFGGALGDIALEGPVFNLVPPATPIARSSSFGVALKLPKVFTEFELLKSPYKGVPAIVEAQYYAHTLIEGSVEWGKEAAGTEQADYHDYFEIEVSTALPLVSSRLVFFGTKGSDFITNATSCPGHNTTVLKLTDVEGTTVERPFTTPIGLSECGEGAGEVPFLPGFALKQGTTLTDAPDGLLAELSLPHQTGLAETASSQVKTATVTLPEGLTINPSGAAGLEACTPEQVGIGTKNPMTCPEGSKLGSVSLNVPGLPNGSLQGKVFLGGPASGLITGPPYTIYVVAESERYGISVRLKGTTTPNPTTGQLTTTFTENPEQPFTSLALHFKGGGFAPLANPLSCGATTATTEFTAFSLAAPKSPTAPFEVTGCPATIPFAPTQSTSSEPAQGGASSTFTLNLERPEGNQYVAALKNILPPGLVGLIPSVTLCGEAEANLGTCTSASQIGTVTVANGSGTPFNFSGKVYLTGPFEGGPYGLSIVVQAAAGPFNLGKVIARVKIEVNPHTAQVILTDAKVPNIVGGIPTRLRSLTVSINRQGFERNPTNCGVLATETTLTGSLGAVATVSTPFQAEGCSGLGFSPKFAASVGGKTTKATGSGLTTTIGYVPGQANIKGVVVTLPKVLPSRLTTLQKACPEATFNANPLGCSPEATVGTATAVTPVLPKPMVGPAILVSHGGAEFPNLVLVLEGNGVRVIIEGATDIKKGVTTSSFVTNPDVPISSFTLSLPSGPKSILGATADLCVTPLVMPTTITGQNGAVVKQNTKIAVTGCGVHIVGARVVGNSVVLTVRAYGAGRISASGANLRNASRTVGGASTVGLKVSLSTRGRSRHRPLRIHVRVGFVPKQKGGAHSSATRTVTFH